MKITHILIGAVFVLVLTVSAERTGEREEDHLTLPEELKDTPCMKIAVPWTVVYPGYTEQAREKEIEADVWIRLKVDRDGIVTEADVAHSSAPGYGLEDSALFAVAAMDFEPSKKRRREIRCCRVKFRLSQEATDIWNMYGAGNEDSTEEYPEMVYSHNPDFPSEALKQGCGGTVWIKVIVGRTGSVVAALIDKESGTDCGLEEAALKAARKCRFKPGKINGKPIPVWVKYPLEFSVGR